ncbi:ComEC/Rec2 family competence protein [Chryseobacterium salviniae]|uniref:ComEC/Rec2 family competence protein n=1 Tax=Chryseobacterium salviniae TaxID=3101750 RepID=A0ABU6HQ28_9FLAO|nr:ComEC/Rec2 family competence protein [Chryseobacterium sp. T9W2-O]MEC3874583.1 ComEC/Rec2 family competence protein [Chryseobacterium sp. T9W2-O]
MEKHNLLKKQPLLILVVFFILGIFFQDTFSLDKTYIFAIAGISLLVVITKFFKNYFLHRIQPYLLCIMFFGVGIILHFFNTYKNPVSAQGNHTIIFKISGKLNSNEKNRKYEALVKTEKQTFNAIIYIPKSEKQLDFNHYYQTKAFVSKPKVPQYDFQFDYSKYLQRKNIDFQCYINDELHVAKRNDVSWAEKFSQMRLEVLQSIDNAQMSSPSKEFLKGIILADRTEIDAQTVQDFSRSGLVHFLAISGTHIVVIFGLFYFLLIKILPVKHRKYAILTSLFLIWLFTAFIGFGSSVVRSSIMLSVYFIYVLLQRKPDLLHSLALSAFIILLSDTQQLFDVGFRLSFLAVLGIFWLNQPILSNLPKQDNWFKKVVFNTISISVSAQVATLPLVLYYFHQFSFISIIANFFIVPFSEIIIVFSFVMTALIAVNADFEYLTVFYGSIIEILLVVIHWFAGFNDVFFENIPMNGAEVFFLFLIVFLLRVVILKCNLKNFTIWMTAFAIFSVMRFGFNCYEGRKTEVLIHDFSKNKVLSVKKNNEACFWIEENSDKARIIKFIINPYCASRRIKRIEIRRLPHAAERIVYQHKIYELK